MSAHILTRSAGASARSRSRTILANSGVVSFIEAFLQHPGDTQVGRPAAKIAEVHASRNRVCAPSLDAHAPFPYQLAPFLDFFFQVGREFLRRARDHVQAHLRE